jgi:N-acetylmuramoyl-L-alanine amidase
MGLKMLKRLSILVLFCAAAAAAANATDDGKLPGNNVLGASESEIQETLKFRNEFLNPSTLAFSADTARAASANAKEAYVSLTVTKGELATKYDVIIQPGHFGRVSGATGGEGKYVTEQQYAAWIAKMLLAELAERKIKAIAIPANGYTVGLTTKMFLALHTDAANFPCSVGPSIAYASVADGPQMHMIALSLALSMDIEPAKFMRDNYTKDEANYYAYKTVDAAAKGLLEMGELTCPKDEATLLSNAEVLAKNLSRAIVFALRPATR